MKRIIIALLLCLCVQSAFAQEIYNSSGKKGEAKRKDLKPKGFDASRLVLGGGAIVSFGNGYANLGLSPMVGYKITDNFAAGIGGSYQYYRNKFYPVDIYANGQFQGTLVYDRKTSLYSGNIWLRYIVWRNLFVHVQPEIVSMGIPNDVVQDPNTGDISVVDKRKSIPCVLVGAGLRQPISGSLSLYAMLLYDVVRKPVQEMPYPQLDFRIGFNIGF